MALGRKKKNLHYPADNRKRITSSSSSLGILFFVTGLAFFAILHVNILQRAVREAAAAASSYHHEDDTAAPDSTSSRSRLAINEDEPLLPAEGVALTALLPQQPSNTGTTTTTTTERQLQQHDKLSKIVEKYGFFMESDAAIQLLQAIDDEHHHHHHHQKDKQKSSVGDNNDDEENGLANNDLFFFYHPPKTGGTSVSNLFKTIFGPEGVVPGSAASGWFHRQLVTKHILDETIDNDGNVGTTRTEWWRPKKILYTHSHLGEVQDGVPFYQWLETEMGGDNHNDVNNSNNEKKQLKLMTMLRDPMDRIASAFNDHICEIGGRLRQTKRQEEHGGSSRRGLKLVPQDPCLGLDHRNLAVMADLWFEDYFKPSCQNDQDALKGSFQYPLCQRARKEMEISGQDEQSFFDNMKDPRPHCRSIPAFLNSSRYQEEHNFFLDTVLQMAKTKEDKQDKNPHYSQASIANIEQEALRQLGGLKGAMGHDEAPMVWFGITERMEESICLLHYTLQLPYEAKTPTNRVQQCRPNNWFQEPNHRALILQREAPEYAIHRAANAIMDIRLEQMCNDMRNMSAKNGSKYLPDSCCEVTLA